MRRPSRTRIWVAAVAFGATAATVAVVLLLVLRGPTDPHAMVVPAQPFSQTSELCSPGSDLYFPYLGLEANAGGPAVHVKSATVTSLPRSLEVVRMFAMSFPEHPGAILGPAPAALFHHRYNPVYEHPLTDITLEPGMKKTQWWIVAVFRAKALGDFRTQGLEVGYTAGKRAGATNLPLTAELVCHR